MPQAPNVDGLPLWLQVALSLIFAALTLMVALRGYRTGTSQDRQDPKTTFAALADMGAVRALTDVCRNLTVVQTTLCSEILSLNRTLADHNHFTRDQIEVSREVAQRLREARDRLEELEKAIRP